MASADRWMGTASGDRGSGRAEPRSPEVRSSHPSGRLLRRRSAGAASPSAHEREQYTRSPSDSECRPRTGPLRCRGARSVRSRIFWLPQAASAAWPVAIDERPCCRLSAVVEHRLADRARSRPGRRCTATVRTSMCSASSSVGGARVRRDRVFVPSDGPIVSASRTTTQPVGRIPGGDERVRPRLVMRASRDVDPERPEPEAAALAVEQAAEHARGVETAGHRASRSRHPARRARPYGSSTRTRSRRSAETAMGPPRSVSACARSLSRSTAPCQPPWPATSSLALRRAP